jgi:hypothetical protein
LKQKAEQGSQQLQGEVLELELENLLRERFPHDEIEAISNGQRGADILQRVCTSSGEHCGAIVWETKRTRHWSNAWVRKLKEDQRSHAAELAVLVSQVLPDNVGLFGQLDGVWVAEVNVAVALAGALRQGLIYVNHVRRTQEGRNDKMALLYEYLAGTEFRQTIEAIVEAWVELKHDLEAEKRTMERQWKKRDQQLNRAIANTAAMYGSFQGIIGQAALPGIQPLQLGDGTDRDTEK